MNWATTPGGSDHPGGHLLRLRHPQQEIENELVGPLHDDGPRAEHAARHPFRNDRTHLRVLNLLAERTFLLRTPGGVKGSSGERASVIG